MIDRERFATTGRLDQHVKNFHPGTQLDCPEQDDGGMQTLINETLAAEGEDVLLSMSFVEKIVEDDDAPVVQVRRQTVDLRYLSMQKGRPVVKSYARRRYPCVKQLFEVEHNEERPTIERGSSDESELSDEEVCVSSHSSDESLVPSCPSTVESVSSRSASSVRSSMSEEYTGHSSRRQSGSSCSTSSSDLSTVESFSSHDVDEDDSWLTASGSEDDSSDDHFFVSIVSQLLFEGNSRLQKNECKILSISCF